MKDLLGNTLIKGNNYIFYSEDKIDGCTIINYGTYTSDIASNLVAIDIYKTIKESISGELIELVSTTSTTVKPSKLIPVSQESTLKDALVANLMHNSQIVDEPYIAQNGGRTYTRRELCEEIKNNTDMGIKTMISILSFSIEMLNKQRKR